MLKLIISMFMLQCNLVGSYLFHYVCVDKHFMILMIQIMMMIMTTIMSMDKAAKGISD